jgi:hypothetical protein
MTYFQKATTGLEVIETRETNLEAIFMYTFSFRNQASRNDTKSCFEFRSEGIC